MLTEQTVTQNLGADEYTVISLDNLWFHFTPGCHDLCNSFDVGDTMVLLDSFKLVEDERYLPLLLILGGTN